MSDNPTHDLQRKMMLGIDGTAYEEIKDQGGDPAAIDKHLDKFNNLAEYGGYDKLKHNGSPFHLVRALLQHMGLIGMSVTIYNMTEKVASFETGRALWFTDLTTPDTSLIFPLVTGLTLWIAIECDAMVGYEGMLVGLKKVVRFCFIHVALLGIFLPKAVHCYMMSCMLFSIVFMHVIRRPGVRKHFDIPEVPPEHMVILMYTRLLKKYGAKWLSRR